MAPNKRRKAKPSFASDGPDNEKQAPPATTSQQPKSDAPTLSSRPPPVSTRRSLRKSGQPRHFLCSPAILAMTVILSFVGILLYFRQSGNSSLKSDKPDSMLKGPTSHDSSRTTSPADPFEEILIGPFEVVDLPGRGKGVIATRDIQRGELLLRERPLFRLPTSITSSPVQVVQEALQKLPPSRRDLLLNLSHPNHDLPPHEIPFDIVQVNAMAAGSTTAVFPRIARLNHGCAGAFNSIYGWREEQGVMELRPFRDIKKGEELLVSYFDTKRPRSERRAYLKDHYHFHCQCAVCSLPEKESRVSDDRLITMRSLISALSAWPSGGIDGKKAIDITNELWGVSELEQYWSERGVWASDAAQVAASHSDAEATKRWLSLSKKWYSIALGEDSEQASFSRRFEHHPRRHPAWGSRTPMTVGGPAFS